MGLSTNSEYKNVSALITIKGVMTMATKEEILRELYPEDLFHYADGLTLKLPAHFTCVWNQLDPHLLSYTACSKNMAWLFQKKLQV